MYNLRFLLHHNPIYTKRAYEDKSLLKNYIAEIVKKNLTRSTFAMLVRREFKPHYSFVRYSFSHDSSLCFLSKTIK